MNTQTDAPLRRVKDDIATLLSDAEDLLKATAGELGDKAKDARARLSTAIANARETCEKLEVRAAEAGKSADAFVREHPYQVVGASFAVGVLAGLLIVRR